MTSLLDYKKIDLNNITDNNNNTMTDNKMDLTKLSKTELLAKCEELGFTKYKKAIEAEYPGFSVVYAVLKDEYDVADTKMSKYNYLAANGIPVYNTETYIKDTFGISTEEIEIKRQTMVMELAKKRFKESGLNVERLIAMFAEK